MNTQAFARPAVFSEGLSDLGLVEIAQIFWRRRFFILVIAAVVSVLGGGVVWLQPTYYTASTTVILNDDQLKLDGFTDVTEGPKFTDFTVQTEVRVLTSSDLALQTIRSVGLDKISEFSSSSGDRRDVLAAFSERLSVAPQGNSRVIEVSFKSRDPELSARVANAHVEGYLKAQITAKKVRIEGLRTWFENKVAELKRNVAEKSRQLAQYRVQAALPIDALLELTDSSHIRDLKAQEGLLATELSGLQAKYGSRHPAIRVARERLAEVRQAIAFEIDALVGSSPQEEALSPSPVSRGDVQSNLLVLKGLLLEREASQKLLDSFLSNYETIQSQISFARPDAVVVSRAIAPIFPAKPGKKILLLMVLALAGGLALGGAVLLEMLQRGVRNFDDVRRFDENPLAVLPEISDPLQTFLKAANSSLKEAIKRVYIGGFMDRSLRTVMITSALPQEGRSIFTELLGRYLTAMGHKVLVVDADFFKPDLSRLASLPGEAGFSDLLAGQGSLSDLVQRDSRGLFILRSGRSSVALPDLLRAENLGDVLARMKMEYTYILIDSGPVLARNEASEIAGQVDGVLALVRWNKTSLRDVRSMFEILHSLGAKVRGVVLNRVDLARYKETSSGVDLLLPKISAVS